MNTESIVCSACGTENGSEAVFCTGCHKALGEFLFVREEFDKEITWHERLADRVAAFIGRPHFLTVHTAWFLLWIVLNTGMVALVHKFDEYPYNLLSFLLAIEAVFITAFLLISQNRENAFASRRAELDYEVSVRTYRKLLAIEERIEEVHHRLDAFEKMRKPD